MTDSKHPTPTPPRLSAEQFTYAEFCRFVQEAKDQRARAEAAEEQLAQQGCIDGSLLYWRARAEAAEAERNRLRAALDATSEALVDIDNAIQQEADPLGTIAGLVWTALNATDTVAAADAPSAPEFSVHIHGSHLMPIEIQDALMRAAGHIVDAYKAGWRPRQPGPIAPPAPATCAHGHPDCCGHHDLEDMPIHEPGA